MMTETSLTLFLICACISAVRSIHFPVSPVGRIGTNNAGRILLQKDIQKDLGSNERLKKDGKAESISIIAACNSSMQSFSSFLELTASAAATSAVAVTDQLTYMQTMTAGALSRTMAQTLMHPANTYKTLLQLKGSESKTGILTKLTPERLLRGVDAQFIMSIPHGACYFFVIDQVKTKLSGMISSKYSFLQDFAASTISTVFCSIVSTPQMVLTDRLMAGIYPSFPVALKSILSTEGIAGFYTGWWPALAQKIPSYGLTWMFFQQLKRSHEEWLGSVPNGEVSFVLGAVAAAASVTVMIPMDTIKTRLVIQMAGCPVAYKGVRDCFYRILKEEGVGAFYRSLPPRLMSVVPMIAIQFGVYETLKTKFLHSNKEQRIIAAQKLKARTMKSVTAVRTSAAAMARTARKTGANVSSKAKGKVLDIRSRRRLNGERIIELGLPDDDEENCHDEENVEPRRKWLY